MWLSSGMYSKGYCIFLAHYKPLAKRVIFPLAWEKMTKKLLKLSNVEIKSQKFHYSKIDFNKILIAIKMDYRKI